MLLFISFFLHCILFSFLFSSISINFHQSFECLFRSSRPFNLSHACKNNGKSSSVKLFLVFCYLHFFYLFLVLTSVLFLIDKFAISLLYNFTSSIPFINISGFTYKIPTIALFRSIQSRFKHSLNHFDSLVVCFRS